MLLMTKISIAHKEKKSNRFLKKNFFHNEVILSCLHLLYNTFAVTLH